MNGFTVIHPDGALGGNFAICRTCSVGDPWFKRPHCPSCTCEPQADPPHGSWVECGFCHQVGILPDRGHEIDFMPAGASWTWG